MLLTDDHRVQLRKAELVGVLERLCQSLELTDTQYQQAKQRYEAVGAWLAGGDSALLKELAIYLQGSTILGTTVKPIGRNEHDVDLIAYIAHLTSGIDPAAVKKAIGIRLRANGHYASLLEEMPRCWRINYANEFHLDITPSIPNPACANGGELVPDKILRSWTRTNPRGYRALFERRAMLAPRFRLLESRSRDLRAEMEPYPQTPVLKGLLRRTIQIAKRHRDQYFLDLDPCLAPISVILTTLASRSYEYCVARQTYETEFDLLCDVIRHMPAFIDDVQTVAGTTTWYIWNETTAGENFAEKWISDPRRADAFHEWHTRALRDIETLADVEGLDRLTKHLRESFGPGPANQAIAGFTRDVSDARNSGRLTVAPAVGLTLGPSFRATPVRSNTFFGSE